MVSQRTMHPAQQAPYVDARRQAICRPLLESLLSAQLKHRRACASNHLEIDNVGERGWRKEFRSCKFELAIRYITCRRRETERENNNNNNNTKQQWWQVTNEQSAVTTHLPAIVSREIDTSISSSHVSLINEKLPSPGGRESRINGTVYYLH